MRVVVIGAGILGAAIAAQLARAGAEVTVIAAGQEPAGAATGASFGWINACYHLDADHFRLRVAGMEAWRRLQAQVEFGEALSWPGTLWWEAQGEAMSRTETALRGLGYAVTRLTRAEVAAREPALADPPAEALHFADEGVAEPGRVTRALLREAARHGARALFGLPVTALRDGAVETPHGGFEADRIVLCAGIGAPALLEGLGARLPLLPRPALVLQSAPLPRCLSHVHVTPLGDIRQDAAGRIVLPAAIGHQSDDAESLPDRPDRVAEAAARRVRAMLRTGAPFDWASATLAMRPFPADGRPVVGACPEGPYVAVMHSGITLAAITAELAAAEILGASTNRTELLAPYRPGRFAA